jgi:uncharacterized small protein (DUF1192 family)
MAARLLKPRSVSSQGTDARTLLRGSLKYFKETCNQRDADEMRLESVKEAAPRLALMLATLEKEIEKVDAQLKNEQKAVEEERNVTITGFLEGLYNPLLQNVSCCCCCKRLTLSLSVILTSYLLFACILADAVSV